MYVDFGTAASDKATLTFNWNSATSTTRIFEIKLTQIPCGADYKYVFYVFQALLERGIKRRARPQYELELFWELVHETSNGL